MIKGNSQHHSEGSWKSKGVSEAPALMAVEADTLDDKKRIN
jgi:hypothetical protein